MEGHLSKPFALLLLVLGPVLELAFFRAGAEKLTSRANLEIFQRYCLGAVFVVASALVHAKPFEFPFAIFETAARDLLG